jgi:hypothetical protein
MSTRNDTRVTTTTIRSSMEFLLVGLWVIGSQSISTFSVRGSIPAVSCLHSQPQKCLHRERFWQIGQWVKFSEPTWADPDGGKHDDREPLDVTLDLLRTKPAFPLSGT